MSHSDFRRLKEVAVGLGYAEPSVTAKRHLTWPHASGVLVVTVSIRDERQFRTARASLRRHAHASVGGAGAARHA